MQRGDSLELLLFALGPSRLTQQLSAQTCVELNVWFCDNGVLVGSSVAVRNVLKFRQCPGSQISLLSIWVHANISEVFLPMFPCSTIWYCICPKLNKPCWIASLMNPSSRNCKKTSYVGSAILLLSSCGNWSMLKLRFWLVSKPCLSSRKVNQLLKTTATSSIRNVLTKLLDTSIPVKKIIGRGLTEERLSLPLRCCRVGWRRACKNNCPVHLASR